ncbi:alpha-D-ribose 1-methylphosphonate 5-triphosphate diphosphatase, partial [Pseudomonas aeruginosa]
MSSERVLSNARVVSAERVFVGTGLLRAGLIAAGDEGRSHLAGAEDLGGDYLLTGLDELHTDNLEKHMSPRPGGDVPSATRRLATDSQTASA